MWFFAVLIVLLIGGIAVVAAGAGDSMAEEYDDRPDVRVQADGPLTGDDLRAVRFTTAVRGYRASEVDALLARLARELEEREHRGGWPEKRVVDGPPDEHGEP
jgi:DivIVA domain-containing protein